MRSHSVALYNFTFPILIEKLTNYPVAGIVLEDTEKKKYRTAPVLKKVFRSILFVFKNKEEEYS